MLPLPVSAQPGHALLKLPIGQILLGAFGSADATVEALERHSLSPGKHSADYPEYDYDCHHGPNPRPLDHFRHLPVLFLSLATSVFRQGRPEWRIKLFVSLPTSSLLRQHQQRRPLPVLPRPLCLSSLAAPPRYHLPVDRRSPSGHWHPHQDSRRKVPS